MKTDRNGCSTCPIGGEQYEDFEFQLRPGEKQVQYDYRHTNGVLFSTIATTLEAARKKRDAWLDLVGGKP